MNRDSDADITLFSDQALQLLDRMQRDPNATASYDVMSGGLHWSDEFPSFGHEDFRTIWCGFLPRYVLAHRAALTMGDSQEGLLPLWQQLCEFAPNWPGLLPERRGARAKRRLLAARRREARCLEQVQREWTALD